MLRNQSALVLFALAAAVVAMFEIATNTQVLSFIAKLQHFH